VHLYYATVTNGDMVAKSAGADLADGGDEDIEIRNLPVEKLFEMVDTRQVEDPKLLIGALWLKGELQKQLSDPLPYSTAEYSLAQHPDLRVGYKTGHISGVKGVDIWVNSENEDMVMDRYIGRTISASIRFLGARKDEEGNLTEDIINDELTTVVGSSAPVKIGTVFTTGSGHLQASHGVNAILHVATVRGVEHGYKVEPELVDLATCVGNVMQAADKMNRSFWRRLRREKVSESILFPIIGAGIQLGLHPDQVIPGLLDAAIRYLQDNPTTTIKRIYFLAFTGEQRAAIIRALGKYCDDGTIRAM
jgi:O-acetyl-ADP-ribose deacetylase (regulator of RNase III)